ncbi:DoxX family protein [Glaesserella parasuis]|nr:DoxX family protein [Glaesserella parasuis]
MIKNVLAGFGLLGLRLFVAYEFFEACLEIWYGQNWVADIQEQFPFPFYLLPSEINWAFAMGAELLFPLLLVVGLFTRFSALGLSVLTIVAWYAVHSGMGYNVCQNGYKMALVYLVILAPLMFQGAGMVSVDFWLQKRFSAKLTWLKFC